MPAFTLSVTSGIVYQEFSNDSQFLTKLHLFLVNLYDVVCTSVNINSLFHYRVAVSGILKLQGFSQGQNLPQQLLSEDSNARLPEYTTVFQNILQKFVHMHFYSQVHFPLHLYVEQYVHPVLHFLTASLEFR